MIKHPTMQFRKKTRTTITEFRGLNHTPTCAPGEWYEARNVSTIEYPMLTTHGDRETVDELGGYAVPDRDIIAVCGSEPPTYLDNAGKITSGGHSVSLSDTPQIAWAAKTQVYLDKREAEPVFTVNETGAAALATLLGISSGSGTLRVRCVSSQTTENPDNSQWAFVDNSNWNILAVGLLSDYGITRYSQIGVATASAEAFYVNVYEVVINALTQPRQMVQMGAWVLIWPDKWYCNAVKLASGAVMTSGTDYGSIDAANKVTATAGHPVYTYLCHQDGTPYVSSNTKETGAATPSGAVYWGKDEPWNPNNTAYAAGDLWLSVDSKYNVLAAYAYSASMGWMPTTDYGVKIVGSGIASGLKTGYNITVSGWAGTGSMKAEREAINGGHRVIDADANGDWMILDCVVTTSATMTMTIGKISESVNVPDLDYVVEAQNRLWGCYYGVDANGEVLNEIYASALGDFRSWRQYEGLSTDSWTASRGSPGPFTGAAALGGNPLFFKENYLEKIYPSATGAHQIQTISLNGVQAGCAKSLVVIDDALYYKSPLGVCVYSGTLPKQIGYKLGPEATEYGLATAGRSGKRYVIELQGAQARYLYIYDTDTGMWQEEEPINVYLYEKEGDVPCMVTYGDELYVTHAGALLRLDRNAGYEEGIQLIPNPDGPGLLHVPKEGADWYAVTGNLGLESGLRKYISRIRLRAKFYQYNTFRVHISYDDGQTWDEIFERANASPGDEPRTINIYPRRCDRFRLKFSGIGRFELQLLEYYIETGSDVYA